MLGVHSGPPVGASSKWQRLKAPSVPTAHSILVFSRYGRHHLHVCLGLSSQFFILLCIHQTGRFEVLAFTSPVSVGFPLLMQAMLPIFPPLSQQGYKEM